ncbi:hypothetical protein F0562_006154 [Nyssa sinensis]|uniref:Uncharacterized protein n=1 Tax=Nyssa sinensis TaxID=561372 RepID=A0A5J5AKB6_9ASTE|nr:hypothetical protein F0562_006154 [Nyssa sinensis]
MESKSAKLLNGPHTMARYNPNTRANSSLLGVALEDHRRFLLQFFFFGVNSSSIQVLGFCKQLLSKYS